MYSKEITYFLNNITTSIYDWSFFSDFNKMESNSNKYKKELKTLESLLNVKESNIDNILLSLIDNIKVRQALLLLVALRPSQLKEVDILIGNNLHYNYYDLFVDKKIDNEEEKLFLEFFNNSGLKNFFLTSHVDNLFDYCKGVEIGLDTNARKNRTGFIMEKICEENIKNICIKNNWTYLSQVSSKNIKDVWNIDIKIGNVNRRYDFAIKDELNNINIIEVNFYNSVGSKIKATAKEYIYLSRMLNDINFCWITDGKAWFKNKSILAEIPLDFNLLTIKDISNGNLENIINGSLKKS